MAILNIRSIDEEAARAIKADAALHGLTLAEWLTAVSHVIRELRSHEGSIIIDPEGLKRVAEDGAVSGADYTEVAGILEMYGLT